MGSLVDPKDIVISPTTVPASQNSIVVKSDLDLQSLRDMVETLIRLVAASGQSRIEKAALAPVILTVSQLDLTPVGVQFTATWTDKA